MRSLAAVERDIQRITRQLDIHTQIMSLQWAITCALKTPDSDLDECQRNLDRYKQLLNELESNHV